jgi:hypothetical protein
MDGERGRRKALLAIVVLAVLAIVVVVAFENAKPRTYTIDCGYVNDALGHYVYESTLPPGEAPCPSARPSA